jgi:hypothetical protein
VNPEKRGNTDEDADGEAEGNMAGVTVQGENFFKPLFPGLFIEQTDSPAVNVR